MTRNADGVDRRALDLLEQQGLLTEEGRRLKARLAAVEPQASGQNRRPGQRPAGPNSGPRPFRAPSARPEAGAEERRPAPGRPLAQRAGAGKGEKPQPRRPGAPETLVAERLHKVMAQAGVASRRHSEELIRAGRVTVNGMVVTEMGSKVLAGKDIIEVDGRPLGRPEQLIYILLNKPKNYVTTLFDPQNRPKVVDLLGGDIGERVYPVGRLDFDTEGLLLLTNDGELANALMHPSRKVKKTYIAKVRGVPGPGKIAQLEQGMELDDGPTAPAEVKLIDVKAPNAATLSVRIHEGRNRQVRRMFEALGHEVIHLRRTTLGPLTLHDLMPGDWRELNADEVADLRASAGLQAPRLVRSSAIRPGAGERERPVRKAPFRPAGPRPDDGERPAGSRAGGEERRPGAPGRRPGGESRSSQGEGPTRPLGRPGFRSAGPGGAAPPKPGLRRPGSPGAVGVPQGGPRPKMGGPRPQKQGPRPRGPRP